MFRSSRTESWQSQPWTLKELDFWDGPHITAILFFKGHPREILLGTLHRPVEKSFNVYLMIINTQTSDSSGVNW